MEIEWTFFRDLINRLKTLRDENEALKAELKALRAKNNILRTWATQAKSENKALRAQLDLYKPMYRGVMATLLGLSTKY